MRVSVHARVLLLAAPLAFSGCVVPQPAGVGAAAPTTDLKFCGVVQGIAWFQTISQETGRKWIYDLQAGAPGLRVGPAASPDEAAGQECDVYLTLHFTGAVGDSFQLLGEAFSTYSGRSLLKTNGYSGAMGGLGGSTRASLAMVGGALAREFAIDSPHYRKVVEEREAKKAQAVAAANPSSGISKSELKELVEAAVSGSVAAQQKKAAAEAPSNSPPSDVDNPKFKKEPNPDDFAVVVGIENYAGLPRADFAEHDAQAVQSHLAALGVPPRNIEYLGGVKASRAGLVKTIETKLPNLVNERSTVYFFFSGHGAPDPKTGQAYLVPSDGDPEYLEDTAYPLKRLYEKLGALKAKRVLVALDSCFSGAGGRSVLPKGTRPLVTKVDIAPKPGKLTVMTASAGQQISGTIEDQGHGAFTYYLLRGLNGAAKDDSGSVTVKSLFDYLSPNVQDSAHRSNRDQTPQLLSGSRDAEGFGLR